MFGDLEKYKNEEYFNSHLDGWLYAGGRYYRLDAFAVMMTDAYDENVYSIDALTIDERIDYISANSLIYRQLSDSDREALELFESEGVTVLDQLQKSGDPAMVLALSTCESAITNGRIVVFCMAIPVNAKDLPGFNNNGGENVGNDPKNVTESPNIIDRLTAIGHPFGSDKWAFLNIVCVFYCIYVTLPFTKTKVKFKQGRAAKKVKDLYSGYGYSGADAMAIIRYGSVLEEGRIRSVTFGNFEVYYNGEPIKFGYKKTKELLAYLIDRRGAMCTNNEIIAVIWEDDDFGTDRQDYLKKLKQDLTKTFSELGSEDVVVKQRGQIGINPKRIECDYFKYLEGDSTILNSYQGEYMSQYSWAEYSIFKRNK